MSRLEDLIKKLCPNGVEFKTLGEVLDYEQPQKYIVESPDYESQGTPVLTAGQSFILGYTNETDGIFQASRENPVIIFDDFTTSFHWVDFNFKVKSSAMKMLRPSVEDVSFKFIYYAMECIKYETLEHSRQWISKYSLIQIPLPPLEVQQEIARILDKFATLEAELETELEARKKQYLFYREKLLESNENTPYRVLGEVCEIRNGYTPSKAKGEYWQNGTIPWFVMEDIRKNGRVLSDSIQHITREAVKGGRLFPANSIILATSATVGEHALITVEHLSNQRFVNLKIKDSYKDAIDLKYLFYYMFVVDEWCKNNVNVSGFASVDMTKFRKLQIPVPPLAEQKRIVEILDKFSTLIDDISSGLPAEIKMRHQQYEYYRDKLLTFTQAA